MSKELDSLTVVGRDITWKELHTYNKSGLLRVNDFTRLAKIDGYTVRAESEVLPYGILKVFCLEMDSELTLYITHKIDFFHVSNAFDWCNNPKAQEKAWEERVANFNFGLERGLCSKKAHLSFRDWYIEFWDTREFEVIIGDFHLQQRISEHKVVAALLRPILPRLFVWVCPSGYVQRLVSNEWGDLNGWEAFQLHGPLAEWKPQI